MSHIDRKSSINVGRESRNFAFQPEFGNTENDGQETG